MTKQKILIFVGILVLLLIASVFYFLIQKDSILNKKVENKNTPLAQEEKEEKDRETLNSFEPPSDLKSEAEAREDLNKVAPPKEVQTRTEEESRNDLLNITR